jgi:hypothetical protein
MPRALSCLSDRHGYGTAARNMNTAKITKCTDPWRIVVRPVASVTVLIKSVRTSKTVSSGARPKVKDCPSIIAARLTMGIVKPMVAMAEPSARFKLVCSRFLRAARMADIPSGNRTTAATTTPTNAFGSFAAATKSSRGGERTLASKTTAKRETHNRARLISVLRPDGRA